MLNRMSVLPFHWWKRPTATVYTREGPVFAMEFSRSGDYLAAGGPDGLSVWNLKTLRLVRLPVQYHDQRVSVACLAWATRRDEDEEVLCYGNSLGYLVVLKLIGNRFEVIHSQQIPEPSSEITALALNDNGKDSQIAFGTRDRRIYIMVLDSEQCTVTEVHSKQQTTQVESFPKALAFDGTTANNLFIFGIHDGTLRKVRGSDFNTEIKHTLRTHIGNADVDELRQRCAVDNTHDGFDIYEMLSGQFVHTLYTKKAKQTFPKQVKFADRDRLVVGGSDHGLVYIFDSKTGSLAGNLQHSRKGGVETVAVHDTGADYIVVAAASSNSNNSRCSITIWDWQTTYATHGRSSLLILLGVVIRGVIMLAAIAHVFTLYHKLMSSHPAPATAFPDAEAHARRAWAVFKKQFGTGEL